MMAEDNNKSDLIVIEESTKYFSASSAWVKYSDGLEHTFLPPAINAHDSRQNISFAEGGIGTYLKFSYNFTNNAHDEIIHTNDWFTNGRPKHSTHIWLQLPTKGYEDEYHYQWKISQAWYTPNMKWEWLELGWKWKTESKFATLPLGDWDVLHCDSMEFFIGTINTHHMILKDVTLGAYLPVDFSKDNLREYSPCGTRTCHIINNQIYCREFWHMPDPLVIWLIVVVCLVGGLVYKFGIRPLYRKLLLMRAEVVNSEMIDMAQNREEMWELANRGNEAD